MRRTTWLACVLAVTQILLTAAAVPPLGPAASAEQLDDRDVIDPAERARGQGICIDRRLLFGNIIIDGPRCYTLYLVRTSYGSFLGFGPPGPPMIPPGQIVRLHIPAGAKMKGRLFYLVPLPAALVHLPVDAIQFAVARLVPRPDRVLFIVPRPWGNPLELLFLPR